MIRTASLVLALALATAGCASSRGGVSGWREVRTRNFVIRTDTWSQKAQDLAWSLEADHALMLERYFLDLGDEPVPIEVVVFSSSADFDRYAPPGAWAFYDRARGGSGTIVMETHNADAQRTAAVHELAHHLAWRTYLRQPPWFSEGLAGFMESLAPLSRREFATFAGMPRHLRGRGGFAIANATAVVTARSIQSEAEYRVSWALFHLLYSTDRERFGRFTDHLRAGDDPTEAWLAIFPEWDPRSLGGGDRLDQALMSHVMASNQWGWRVGTPPRPALTERRLSEPEVHALRLSLPWRNRGRGLPSQELAEAAQAALAATPGSVVALEALAEAQPAQALDHAEAAVRAHPEDGQAWRLLAEHLPAERATEQEAALRRSLELAPDAPDALTALAALLVKAGRSGEALPLATQAAKAAPRSPASQLVLALALEDLGRCRPALGAVENAVVATWEIASPQLRGELRQWLERLERTCGAGPTGAAVP